MSLSLVPASQPTSTAVSLADTAGPTGVHDALRYGQRSLAADVAPKHPLENRIKQWESTRENLDMTLQRNMFGLHAPVRLMMERQVVQQSPAPFSLSSLGGFTRPSNLALDILMGRDEEIRVEDVLVDRLQTTDPGDFHLAMERKLRLP
ncbi:hypothetical protein JCM10213_001874 [Rhodosporidiobolus nylandii]